MTHILLVGAGQLGSRHLQALAQLNPDVDITVLDPSTESLGIAKERYEAVSTETSPKAQFLSSSLEVSQTFDVCIIATNASIRLAVIQQLLQQVTIKNFVLEKILFQSVDQLNEAKALIESYSVNTWVNCPRRMFPLYRELKKRLLGRTNIELTVNGNDWGLACNAIHFIDLWSYLTGESKHKLTLNDLQPQIFDSKRPGYKEVFGTLRGKSVSSSFSLTCNPPDAAEIPLTVHIESDGLSIAIDESKKICTLKDASGHEETMHFDILYQSQLSNTIIESIVTTGSCELTPFEESRAFHAPFLNEMLEFFNQHGDSNFTECPIT
jgi:predicted dehydrogenase